MKFSIRSAMFLTTAASLLFAALFLPNEATACAIVCAFIVAIAIAWLFVIEQWPDSDPWTLGFALSGVCLSLSSFRLPSQWMNLLTEWLHGVSDFPGLGIRRLGENFQVIANYGVGIFLALLIATVISLAKPKRLPPLGVVVIGLLTFAATWFVNNVVLFCVSIALVCLLTWAWFVISQQPVVSNRWLAAFAVVTTAAVFCLKMHLVPDQLVNGLYGLQHEPPTTAADVHLQWQQYSAIARTPMVILFGAGGATLIQGIIRPAAQ